MAIFKAFALATILATLASAAPVQHQKRELVYETVTKVDVTTIDTTITVFASEATPAVESNAGVSQVVATTTAAPQPPAPSPTTATSVPPAPETTTSAPPPPPPAATTTAAPPPAETTTAAAPPPAVTTTAAPAPAPSATTSVAPAAESTSSGSGSGAASTGDGTYYQTATSMSAPSYCDTANDGSSENVVALSADIMTQELCGKTITVTHGGNTATGTVVDRCAGCSAGSVDMSEHMFAALASMSAGRIPISWVYN